MNEILVGILAALGTALITWGAMRSTIAEHEKRLTKTEKDLESLQKFVIESREHFSNQIHSLRDTYVAYQHFNEVMMTMKENYKDLKEDVSKILGLLSDRREA